MKWTVDDSGRGKTVSAWLREQQGTPPWSEVKGWHASGKVFVNDARELDPGRRLVGGETVELKMAAPRPREAKSEVRIVFEDTHVVVIDKPSGISSVPYDEKEQGTAMDLVRDAWRRMGRPATSTPLHIVHRIDKETSGLLCFAKTKKGEKGLAAQLRSHEMRRLYLCVAHGRVASQTIETLIAPDRGDGLRGAPRPGRPGVRAVTHVEALEELRGATYCQVRLETGKTHQIRIHLSERGHPLVGEKVYMRDYENAGGRLLPSGRLLLHAATLGFEHPITGEQVDLKSDPPEDFRRVLESLRR